MTADFDPLGGAHKIERWTNVSEADGKTYEGFTCSCGYFGYAVEGTPDVEPGPGWTAKPGSVQQQLEAHLNVARATIGLGLDTPRGRELISSAESSAAPPTCTCAPLPQAARRRTRHHQ